MKHIIGILGAVIFGIITALILLNVFDMDTDWIYYAICSVAGIIGLFIFEGIYSKIRKNK